MVCTKFGLNNVIHQVLCEQYGQGPDALFRLPKHCVFYYAWFDLGISKLVFEDKHFGKPANQIWVILKVKSAEDIEFRKSKSGAIGPGCIIEQGVRLKSCTVMRGVRVKKHACISSSIIGWHSTVGQWARVDNMTILGEDVHVCDEIYSNGGVVLPHKEIKSNILKPEIVM
ncbi:mannose-1-phosphate guanylyltransferase 1-like [Vigna umbellata]|uniref:mannose-1-phosphate guanylyltransferase 1-like n=1 Tax=Vigna umbellata TaxID=87088 RepID=UPI001F5ED0F7|nr:mannose-1-phosphate guanylyltransferase 1-like [Vigna umbellata]